MNKTILFTDDIFKRLEEDVEIIDIHSKYVIFETCRIFNSKAKLIELVFSVALFEEPRNLQFSIIVSVDSIDEIEELYYMIPEDSNRVLLSDGFEKYFVATHTIKQKEVSDYHTNFYYYLINKDNNIKNVYKLNLNNVDQLLISTIVGLANKGHFIAQNNIIDLMKWMNTENVVNLKYDPEDEFEIVNHHFSKVSRNKGILSIIFKFNNIEEEYGKLFLVTINIKNNNKIFRELKKKNKYKSKEEFIEALNKERYKDIDLIQFDNDCINVDYINEDKFNKDAKAITRSYFYTGNYIFTILMHQRANLFEKIVNTFI